MIALIVLADLILRSRFIVESYTDDGFLPRDLVVSPDCYFSLQMLDGTYAFQLGHFIVAGIGAVMLLVGYRTRTATVTCWLLTVSLHARNGFLLDAGDDLLRSMLFWSLFLPLGLRYSVDARHQLVSDQHIVVSPATAAILLQFACVYFFAGWFKNNEEWRAGTAIEYALGQTQWIRPAGEFLRQYPALLRYLTWGVVWFEIIAPLCLFIPIKTRYFRLFVIPAFWMFQFGLAITIRLHIFPLITTAATIPFLSSVIWPHAVREHGIRKGCEHDGVLETVGHKVGGRARIVWYAALAVLAGSTISIQAANFGKSLLPTEERIVSLIGWNAIWSMYTNTRKYSYQFSTQATLPDDSTVDLINSEVTTSDRLRIQQFHQSYRIRYFLETASNGRPDFPSRYLAHLVYRWNQSQPADRHAVQARIIGTAKEIGTPGPAETTILLEVGTTQAAPY